MNDRVGLPKATAPNAGTTHASWKQAGKLSARTCDRARQDGSRLPGERRSIAEANGTEDSVVAVE